MLAPTCRNASTRSPIGRSCMRAAPDRRYSPPHSASAAVNGRNAVPALPRNSSAALTGNAPPAPVTTVSPRSCFTAMPSVRKASCMTRVSSESSRSCRRVSPEARAASSSTRLEMLFDPGSLTVPATLRMGARSRNSTAGTGAIRRKAASLLLLQPSVARCARPGEYLFQSGGVAPAQQLLHLGELALIAGQFLQQGLAIGDTNVAPHFRMAGGDARGIAKAPGRIVEQLLPVRMPRDLVHQRVGQEVRQMAHRGEHPVVLGRLHAVQPGAANAPGGAHPADAALAVLGQRRQHHLALVVQIGTGRGYAAVLRACDRMAGYELRRAVLEQPVG